MPVRLAGVVGAFGGVGQVGEKDGSAPPCNRGAELAIEFVQSHRRCHQADRSHVEALLERDGSEVGLHDRAGGMSDQVQADRR
jgi:hypothetical protein